MAGSEFTFDKIEQLLGALEEEGDARAAMTILSFSVARLIDRLPNVREMADRAAMLDAAIELRGSNGKLQSLFDVLAEDMPEVEGEGHIEAFVKGVSFGVKQCIEIELAEELDVTDNEDAQTLLFDAICEVCDAHTEAYAKRVRENG